jgi:hypothetical protein
MAQETGGRPPAIEVSPGALAAAAALAAAVRAAAADLAFGAEPAAFAPTLERLARIGDEG